MGRQRGRLTTYEHRQEILALIDEARNSGARQFKACATVGISAKTYQRWKHPNHMEDKRLQAQKTPENRLSDLERQRILKVVNAPENAHLPPSQIVPKLADQGIYLASESTFYRILKEAKQNAHRQRSKPRKPAQKPQAFTAHGPNQLYSWDITYLPTLVKGQFFYLYLVLDVYSRKIVGWQVHDEESSDLAADLMKDICQRENLDQNQVTLHSDNGSPMKGATMLATLQNLGIMTSFSRPAVSNDNPYSESLFRTFKYRPDYPENPFADLRAARNWVEQFVAWYNYEHYHSSIRFVTPQQRHTGEDRQILAHRKQVYQKAKQNQPNRWSQEIRNWEPIKEVHLNPQNNQVIKQNIRAA